MKNKNLPNSTMEEKDDPVWEVLGSHSKVEVDPFFAQRVVREARRWQDDRNWLVRLIEPLIKRPIWLGTAISSTACIVFLAFFASGPSVEESGEHAEKSVAAMNSVLMEEVFQLADDSDSIDQVAAQLEELDYIDTLLAVQDVALLSDADIEALLF